MIAQQAQDKQLKSLTLEKGTNTLASKADPAFDTIAKLAARICDCSAAAISFFEAEREWFKSCFGCQINDLPKESSIGYGFLSDASDYIEVKNLKDHSTYHEYILDQADIDFSFYAAAPIVNKSGLIIGVICVLSEGDNNISKEIKDYLQSLAQQVVVLLENQQHTQAKPSENLAEQAQSCYEIANEITDIIYELDSNGKITFTNQSMVDKTGYSYTELMNMHFHELLCSDSMSDISSHFTERIRKGIAKSEEQLEISIRTKRGKTKWFSQKATLKISERGLVKVYAIATDITNLRKKRQMSHLLEEKHRLLSDYSHDITCLHKKNGITSHVAGNIERQLGYKPNELLRIPLESVIHPQDLIRLKFRLIRALWAGKSIAGLEFRALKADGLYVWMECYLSPIFSNSGSVTGFRSNTRNISEKKAGEENIKRYQHSLNSLNAITSNIDFDFNSQIKKSLEIVSQYLNLSIGMISKINGNDCYILEKHAPDMKLTSGQKFKLEETYSDIIFQEEEVVAIEDFNNSKYVGHPCFEKFQFKSFIGSTYKAQGIKRGDICFYSTETHEPFSIQDIKYMEIVSQIIGFIIERHENRNQLIREKNTLKTFISKSPVAIAMLDHDLNYLVVSEQWEMDNKHKLKGQNIIGLNHYEVFPDVSEEWKEIYQECLNGKAQNREEDPLIHENGSFQWLNWAVRPWYDHLGEIGGIVMFAEDVTNLVWQREELKIAKETAEYASKVKEDFLATMSHEIRTPLNSILGVTHLLNMGNPREDQKENMKLLNFSGKNLLALINDILDLIKINSGKIILESTDFSLAELLESIRDSLGYQAAEKNIYLNLDIEEGVPLVFKGDSFRISQIVNNLVSNALKFTNQGSVTIRLSNPDKNINNKVRISIEDTGIGIPKSKISRILESFTQASSNITRKYGGTGLGLSIVRKLLEHMGSSITVESEPDVGSVFSFELTLPLGDEKHIFNRDYFLHFDIESLYKYELSILYVEDNKSNQYIASKFFERWGIQLEMADNGLVACEMIKKKSYDLVLMDLQMPEMDGFTATKKIRKMKGRYFQNIPIIALTAAVIPHMLDKIKTSGMNDFMPKPFNPYDLYRMIEKYGIIKNKTKKREEVLTPEKYKKAIESYTENDEDLMNILSKKYHQIYLEAKTTLAACVPEEKLPAFVQLIDQLKISNQVIGATQFSEYLDNLAASLKDPEKKGLNFILKNLEYALNQIIKSIETNITSEKKDEKKLIRDFPYLVGILGNNEQAIFETLEFTLKNMSEEFEKLSVCISEKDQNEFTRVAHTLKSQLKSLNAPEKLPSLANELENSSFDDTKRINVFKDEITLFLQKIKANYFN